MDRPNPSAFDILRGPGALRLVLASLVVLHHFSRFAIGTTAVYVFFLLSGYWIQQMWVKKYGQAVQPYWTFIVSRLWRLVPTFIVVNLITVAGFASYAVGREMLSRNGAPLDLLHLLLSNLFILGYGDLPFLPVGTGWSLDVEARFYVVAPAVIWLVRRSPRLMLAAGMGISVAALALGQREGLAPYAAFFIAGMTAAHLDWRPSGRQAGVALAIGGMMTVCCLLVPVLRDAVLGGAKAGPSHELMNHVFSVVLATLALPYAVYTTGRRGGRHDGLYADMAYIVYLLHYFCMVALGYALAGQPTLVRLGVVATTILLIYAVSYLIWRVVDKPMNRRRARWVEARAGRRRHEPAYLADEPRPAFTPGNG